MLGFYMLGVGLVAYLFHEMDERSKGVPTSKGERDKKQWHHEKSYTSDPTNE
ncbi:hypothetical protein [Priestia megaterium]|uniref:hypothetical protein n=1 Tax=Priestia megaterium TaxID=1404 RepID=UPI00298CF2CA|nr:hypothetical protein [Priestia megaterium]